ncbi:MAG: hypothetical protein IT290_10670 [Deltaproteobacteria bacterium]|nr:hypothetical protein [Deltaproteobacteria bacterium]
MLLVPRNFGLFDRISPDVTLPAGCVIILPWARLKVSHPHGSAVVHPQAGGGLKSMSVLCRGWVGGWIHFWCTVIAQNFSTNQSVGTRSGAESRPSVDGDEQLKAVVYPPKATPEQTMQLAVIDNRRTHESLNNFVARGHAEPATNMGDDVVLDPTERELVRKLAKGYNIKAYVVREGKDPYSPEEIDVSQMLKKNPDRGVTLPGQVSHIRFSKMSESQRERPTVSRFDKLGNVVQVGTEKPNDGLGGSDYGFMDVVVMLTRAALEPNAIKGLPTAPSAIPLDLSALGPEFAGQQLTRTFSQPTQAPEARAGVYPVFSLLGNDSAKLLQEHQSVFDRIAAGMAKFEQSWGFAPGTAIQNFQVVNSNQYRMFTPIAQPESINVALNGLNRIAPAALDTRVEHEGFHGLDGRTGYQLSGGEFSRVFADLRSKNSRFLKQISESRFQGMEDGESRSDMDVREFAASFSSSTANPNIQQMLQNEDLPFLNDYFRTGNALMTSVVAQQRAGRLPQRSPRMQLISNIMTFVGDEIMRRSTQTQ